MKNKYLLFFGLLGFVACQKEQITIGPHASDDFYIDHDGVSMHVAVRGNTASGAFVVVVHGGPGASGYLYRSQEMAETLEKSFAVVYYDQRNAGASQGNYDSEAESLEQYGSDLLDVITVLRHRYGQSADVFLLSKSFGGMVAGAFMTTSDWQDLIQGWIFVNATHHYALNDSLTHAMLLSEGRRHIAEGKNTDEWAPIVHYCEDHPRGPYTAEQSVEFNQWARKAESIIEGLAPYNNDPIRDHFFAERIPLTNLWLGRANAANLKFIRHLLAIRFDASLAQVRAPVLVCAGALDFVCPKGLGERFFASVGSEDKQYLVFEKSGHQMQERRAYYEAMEAFVAAHR